MKTRAKIILTCTLASLLISENHCWAQQVGISGNGAVPDPSSILDINVTGMSPKGGLLIPRMTTTERNAISTPAEALLIYNTDTKCFEAYNATTSTWINFGCIGCTLPSAPTAGTHTPSSTQIAWNWNTVSEATGYKWNTVNNYGTATDMTTTTTKTETGLTCNTAYTRYVWAYNNCGISTPVTLNQTSSSCFTCGSAISDGTNTYNTVLIGTQCWMKENLKSGTYVAVHSGAQAAGTKYCSTLAGANDPTCALGGLYEWAVMMNGSASCNGTGSSQPGCTTPVQGICPSGWHVPSHYEWTLLEKNAGTNPGAFPYDETTSGVWLGTDEGNNLRQAGTTNWTSPNTGATDSKGFTGLPGANSDSGSFGSFGTNGFWWSSTEGGGGAWFRLLGYNNAQVHRNKVALTNGFSVRCIKD